MDAKQLREAIDDVCAFIKLQSKDATELLMLTAAQESELGHYIRQINGPALGIFQMEPDTALDIHKNYLFYHPDLHGKVMSIMAGNIDIYSTAFLFQYDLRYNLGYQIAMARIHYRRVPKPLPNHNDVKAMAEYWKQYYNTPLGKGKVEDAIYRYQLHVTTEGA